MTEFSDLELEDKLRVLALLACTLAEQLPQQLVEDALTNCGLMNKDLNELVRMPKDATAYQYITARNNMLRDETQVQTDRGLVYVRDLRQGDRVHAADGTVTTVKGIH